MPQYKVLYGSIKTPSGLYGANLKDEDGRDMSVVELKEKEVPLLDPNGTCLELFSKWEIKAKGEAAKAKAIKEAEEAEAAALKAEAAKAAAKAKAIKEAEEAEAAALKAEAAKAEAAKKGGGK